MTLAADDRKDLTLKLNLAPSRGPAAAEAPAAPPPVAPPQPEPRGRGLRCGPSASPSAAWAWRGSSWARSRAASTLAKKSAITANCDVTTKLCQNAAGEDAASAARIPRGLRESR